MNVGRDKYILVFFFGSCRAFDKVLHGMLPMKIEDLGLETRIRIFFTGYDQGYINRLLPFWGWVSRLTMGFCPFHPIFLKIYFRERERMSVIGGRGAKGEKERILGGLLLCTQPNAGVNPMPLGSCPELKSKVCCSTD